MKINFNTGKKRFGVKYFTLAISLFLTFAHYTLFSQAGASEIPDHGLWPRPEIIPVPTKTQHVEDPVILLNGKWFINTSPSARYWVEKIKAEDWKEVVAPSSIEKQGIRVRRGQEYAYKKNILIPEEFKNKRIILRFEGVTGTAKAWIDGNFLKEHYGGFTVWTCDITDFVTPGQEALLTVGIVDEEARHSTSTFNHGGIIRNVKLMAVPQNHITRFNVETDLDGKYKNAKMKVWTRASFYDGNEVTVKLILRDPAGNLVDFQDNKISLTKERPEQIRSFKINNPLKWDAERPKLYTLRLELIENNEVVEALTKKVGFRKVEIQGKRMLVNGKEIKLRGAGRFDSDPDHGKFLSDEKAWEEVKMLKDANLNHVRPSCYPATSAYLDACDSLGLYVQVENSVTFTRGAQKDTAYTALFMDQMAEMIEEVRSHPSIIIYELANETTYGINIAKTYEYAKAEDPTRPVIYSWSQSVPPGVDWPYEIFSYHYPDWDADLGSPGVAVFNSEPAGPLPEGMPVLHDEFAHGSSYYQLSLARDPGMRNFWGESIKVFWERMFTTDGCLGGAMWAIVDENAFGSWVYEWGAIDLWRRKRPEYWHIKKAYSPIRITEKVYENPGAGNSLIIPIKNWYDHTNLNELEIEWQVNNNESGILRGPAILPHSEGFLEIPYTNWRENDQLDLTFTDGYSRLVDRYLLKIAPDPVLFQDPTGPAPEIRENNSELIVSGKNFEVVFDKNNGLIKRGVYNDQLLIKGGPYFHLTGGEKTGEWVLKAINVRKEKEEAVIKISGSNKPVEIAFEVRIDGSGLITTNYELLTFGVDAPVARKKPWNDQDAGGFQEVGISYLLSEDINQLEWNRNGLWTYYPEDHIGRNTGIARRMSGKKERGFGEEPERPWALDERDFSVFGQYDIGGRGTNDFRSMKEYINYASAINSSKNAGVRVESDGTEAIRLEIQDSEKNIITSDSEALTLRGNWITSPDSLSYFGSEELISSKEGDEVAFSFQGNGFAWIGTSAEGLSSAQIYIDGELVEQNISLFSRESANSILYSKEGLNNGLHTVRIIARKRSFGQAQEERATIPIGAFKILNSQSKGDVLLIVNDQWNYTKMGLGNYMKPPLHIEPGYKNQVRMRMIGKELTIE